MEVTQFKNTDDLGIFMRSLPKDAIEKIESTMTDFVKLMSNYKCAIMEIQTKFNVLDAEFSLQHDRNPINSIKSRLKSFPSIKEKLERKGLPLSVEAVRNNLNDVAGIRVICSFVEDVYMLADTLLQQDDVILISKKDYIKNPKPNGYRSLHLIVEVPIFLANEKQSMRVEIQLRTIAMDFWATLEHQMKYKKGFEFSNEMLNELYSCAQLSAELDSRMGELNAKIAR